MGINKGVHEDGSISDGMGIQRIAKERIIAAINIVP